jgi:hypothetical protein
MTSAAHLAMAEYYATVIDKTWVACPDLPFSEQDTRVCEFLLHAADTHLKLAEATATTRVEVRAKGPAPSSADYPSQLEMLGH